MERSVRTIGELLEEAPAFAGLASAHLELISGCARNRTFAEGELIMREGQPADAFYVLRDGVVTIETFVPHLGARTIETLHPGELLGWSWLVEPYRTAFDARALTLTHAIELDGACLRRKLEDDPTLGRDLLRLFAAVVIARLQTTRMRLLDLYGP